MKVSLVKVAPHALVVLAIAAAGLVVVRSSGSNSAYSQLTAPGRTVPFAVGRATAHHHASDDHIRPNAARVVAEHGGRAFFIAEEEGRPTCYGTGALDARAALVPGSVTCVMPGGKFPSAEQPVLFTVAMEARKDTGSATAQTVSGFAADGVDAVELRAADGALIARRPIVGNSFLMPLASPPRSQLGSLTAFADRKTIYRVDMITGRTR